MIWVLVPLASIIAWAFVEASKQRAAGSNARMLIEALAEQLDEASGERDKLRARVENLEAIVTTETYELDRQAREARIDPSLLDDEAETDVDEGAQTARRIRES